MRIFKSLATHSLLRRQIKATLPGDRRSRAKALVCAIKGINGEILDSCFNTIHLGSRIHVKQQREDAMSAEQESFNLALFLKDYGGHLLGILALVQVWLIAVWKRFFTRGRLDVHPTAAIEVGFSNFGPTIALLGTLRAQNHDVFVRRMRVQVVRLRDQAQHTFGWRAFRSSTISLNPTAPPVLEVAGSFLVTPGTPRQYNVFFASEGFAAEYQAHVQPLRDTWLAFLDTELRKVDEALTGQIARVLENPALSSELFTDFGRAGHGTALHTQLSNGFFWRMGDYELKLFVETASRARSAALRWGFSITEKEENDLRLNAIGIIRELCYLPVVYNFAYKAYVPLGPAA